MEPEADLEHCSLSALVVSRRNHSIVEANAAARALGLAVHQKPAWLSSTLSVDASTKVSFDDRSFTAYCDDVDGDRRRVILVEEQATERFLTRHLVHELRNIGFGIQVALELTSASSAESAEALDHARATLGRLTTLAGALEQLTRGHVQPSIVCDVIELLTAAAERVTPAITLRVVSVGPGSVEVEPELVTRALASLFAATGAHVGSPLTVAVRDGRDGSRLELAIRDDGPGLPADTRRLIIDPTLRRGGRPIGLGPLVARHLIEAQGGSVSVRRLGDDAVEIVVQLASP